MEEKFRVPLYPDESISALQPGAPCPTDAVFHAGTLPPRGPHLMIGGSIAMCEGTCRAELGWPTGVFMRRRGTINPDGDVVEFTHPRGENLRGIHPERKIYLAFGWDRIHYSEFGFLKEALERHVARGGKVIRCDELAREKKS